MVIILPTSNVIKNFLDYKQTFDFYEDGLKGIVKDTLLLSSAWELPGNEIRSMRESGLIEKILKEYEFCSDSKFLDYSGNRQGELFVELIAELINTAVCEMMYSLFKQMVYRISNSNIRWVGDDLIVTIEVLRDDDRADC